MNCVRDARMESFPSKGVFQQISEELRTFYTLSYYPTNPMKDENFRSIVVRPKVEGMKVSTKSGYFARPLQERK
ncbi:MAG: hypothetical protein NVS9B14_14780 [Candidatus Acidiferrum sp.]